MEELKRKLKEQIIERLNLEDDTVSEFENDTPLFGKKLGLDSIDVLELIVLMESDYDIKILKPKEGKVVFNNINSMAEFITNYKK